MKKICYIIAIGLLLIQSGCEREEEIPSSALPPTVTLSADSVAIATGKFMLRAEGLSAYGGPQLQQVDFYKNGEKIGEKTVAPYTFEYDVVENIPDQQLSFHAVLMDRAGNAIKSNEVSARIRVLPIRIEAENATLRGLARIATDQATRENSSNQAKVGAIDNASSGIDATIQILTAGDYLIRVAAGTGFNGTSHKIYIDDKESTTQVYAIPNRGWNVWQTFDFIFPLAAGSHKISIRHQSMFGELDYFEYSKL
ncbi:carbohydrate-binding protein [Sphingobacterium deserti]|uniref:Serine protease n=1 Tax=Sphingobacterium deserti TaxID=1229276 RepID=A0A0B8T0Z6_9SPHI|nr:carbohydrate-binding protein [Sphingobacterium deserti]KGE14492.1 serine protease [Sphingobacterium deserti]